MKTKPKIEIDLAKVTALAAQGLTNEQICDCLGISGFTFYKRQKENIEFREAIKTGRARGLAHVTNKLMQAVDNGNIAATIFYLKARGHWRETDNLNLSSEDGSMTPHIDLSGMDADQIRALRGELDAKKKECRD